MCSRTPRAVVALSAGLVVAACGGDPTIASSSRGMGEALRTAATAAGAGPDATATLVLLPQCGPTDEVLGLVLQGSAPAVEVADPVSALQRVREHLAAAGLQVEAADTAGSLRAAPDGEPWQLVVSLVPSTDAGPDRLALRASGPVDAESDRHGLDVASPCG